VKQNRQLLALKTLFILLKDNPVHFSH